MQKIKELEISYAMARKNADRLEQQLENAREREAVKSYESRRHIPVQYKCSWCGKRHVMPPDLVDCDKRTHGGWQHNWIETGEG